MIDHEIQISKMVSKYMRKRKTMERVCKWLSGANGGGALPEVIDWKQRVKW